jgi:hypothetical protein
MHVQSTQNFDVHLEITALVSHTFCHFGHPRPMTWIMRFYCLPASLKVQSLPLVRSYYHLSQLGLPDLLVPHQRHLLIWICTLDSDIPPEHMFEHCLIRFVNSSFERSELVQNHLLSQGKILNSLCLCV